MSSAIGSPFVRHGRSSTPINPAAVGVGRVERVRGQRFVRRAVRPPGGSRSDLPPCRRPSRHPPRRARNRAGPGGRPVTGGGVRGVRGVRGVVPSASGRTLLGVGIRGANPALPVGIPIMPPIIPGRTSARRPGCPPAPPRQTAGRRTPARPESGSSSSVALPTVLGPIGLVPPLADRLGDGPHHLYGGGGDADHLRPGGLVPPAGRAVATTGAAVVTLTVTFTVLGGRRSGGRFAGTSECTGGSEDAPRTPRTVRACDRPVKKNRDGGVSLPTRGIR